MAEHATSSAQVRPIRLLLVEDDPADRDRVRQSIELADPFGFEIDQALEVESALTMLKSAAYDVMLLDLTLPEGDGLDTFARARVAADSVPIIALTSQDDPQQAIRAVRMGAQDCVVKGAEPRQLIRTLHHAVERHRLRVELQLARQREHYLATHDSLTGLANRLCFEEQLTRALAFTERYDRRLAVMFLDLDRFKNINDTMGHPTGDQLLRLAAERLRGIVRRSDMLARLGGDEFILMLQGVEHDFAPAKVAETILELLADPYELEGRRYTVTGSIGIAVAPRDGTSVEELLRKGDTAMYQAKAEGGGCYRLYDQSMNDRIHRRVTLECRLREAFENDRLEVHYQPKVCLRTGRITGSEALLRWTDPELGAISPVEFIPLAEEAGLIQQIGDWTLATACAQTRAWQQAGHPSLSIAVNLSAAQISSGGLQHSLTQILWDSGLEPSSLELELTEGVLMRKDGSALEALRKIKRVGISLALDDFGTGFSSLSYLKAVPIDTLKIDRSFVDGYGLDPDDDAIVSAIVSISEKLGLGLVAEGVETEAQRRLLEQIGCREYQGYLCSPALPAEAFFRLLQERSGS